MEKSPSDPLPELGTVIASPAPVPTSATPIGTREYDDWSGDSFGRRGDLEAVARNALESTEYKASERAVWRLRWSKWEFVR